MAGELGRADARCGAVILLDTQALIWLMQENGRLGSNARRAEAEDSEVFISAITLWEIGLLTSRQRLVLPQPLDAWTDRVEHEAAIGIIPVSRVIAIDAGLLPSYDHRDPGDRIVLATARHLSCPVITSDRRMLDYASAGHVQVIDARR